MAAPNVKLAKGTSVGFSEITKDPDTLYFITDTHEIYLGEDRYNVGSDIEVVFQGEGDVVEDIEYIQDSHTLIITLGLAGKLESVKSEIASQIQAAIGSIAGVMRYIGISTHPIQDGSREMPIIDGQSITDLNKGDVVIYETKEFVWSGTYWHELGDVTDVSGLVEEAVADGVRESKVYTNQAVNNLIIQSESYLRWQVEDGTPEED